MAKSGAIYFTGREGRERFACTTSFSPRTCELQALSKLDYLAIICCNQAFRVALTDKAAGLIHIMAAESERDAHFMLETETSTHGHVMLHISDFRHFMLQSATLYACCKVAPGLSQRSRYASRVWPIFRENHSCSLFGAFTNWISFSMISGRSPVYLQDIAGRS